MYKKIVLLCIILFIPFFVSCKNKDDIIDYVNAKKFCDIKTNFLYNYYKKKFINLLYENNLSEADAEYVYTSIDEAYKIINNAKVCKISNLGNLSLIEQEQIKYLLYSSMDVIKNGNNMKLSSDNEIEKKTEAKDNVINMLESDNINDNEAIDDKINVYNSSYINEIKHLNYNKVFYNVVIYFVLFGMITYTCSIFLYGKFIKKVLSFFTLFNLMLFTLINYVIK